ncbi:MAG: 16S rRNA (guanine(527)-N(7))-methyltransferase RsmG [Desulfobacteraceae bacterium]|nr:16S rRNA (guanine(527)-N(7))-methyltransferase RsmG [Desulfobacteraceae bacterium]
MDVNSDRWMQLLIDAGAQMQVTVEEHQARMMAQHAQMLLAWNKKTNLTAIVDPIEIAVKHYLDSLAGLSYIKSGNRVLDMGTGAGFPGLPLKIMLPGLSLVLADSSRKKISFIKHAVRTIGLKDVEPLQARVEQLAQNERFRSGFDVVTCRALKGIDQIIKWALPFLSPNGRIVAYKAAKEIIETTASKENSTFGAYARQFKIQSVEYHLPINKAFRRILIIQPKAKE